MYQISSKGSKFVSPMNMTVKIGRRGKTTVQMSKQYSPNVLNGMAKSVYDQLKLQNQKR